MVTLGKFITACCIVIATVIWSWGCLTLFIHVVRLGPIVVLSAQDGAAVIVIAAFSLFALVFGMRVAFSWLGHVNNYKS